jgi:hypothetical protein
LLDLPPIEGITPAARVPSQDPTQLIDDGITGFVVPGEAEKAVAAIGRRVGASLPF